MTFPQRKQDHRHTRVPSHPLDNCELAPPAALGFGGAGPGPGRGRPGPELPGWGRLPGARGQPELALLSGEAGAPYLAGSGLGCR